MRAEYKKDPYVAAVRKDMADVYRNMRKDNPAAARLLRRRYMMAYFELQAWFDNKLYNEGFGGESLNEFFE